MNGQARFLILLGGLFLALQVGCKDGPVPEMRYFNPMLRKEWDADEHYATTFHKRLEELAKVQSRAKSLSVSDQQRLTREVADALREEKSPAMRLELVKTLGLLPTSEAQVELVNATTDEDADVRAQACRGLGMRQSKIAVETLEKVLTGDSNNDVRLAACRQLGAIRTPDAEKVLRQMIDEGDPAMQRTAALALREAGMSVPTPAQPSDATHLSPERNWPIPFASMGKGPPPGKNPINTTPVESSVERTAEVPASDGIRLR